MVLEKFNARAAASEQEKSAFRRALDVMVRAGTHVLAVTAVDIISVQSVEYADSVSDYQPLR